MARIKLEFAELCTPLFLGGRNFGLKLDNTNNKFPGLDLAYDQTEKELWITHNQKTAIIPTSNVVSMTPVTAEKKPDGSGGPVPLTPSGKIKAQVSSPTSHVFSDGPGHSGRG